MSKLQQTSVELKEDRTEYTQLFKQEVIDDGYVYVCYDQFPEFEKLEDGDEKNGKNNDVSQQKKTNKGESEEKEMESTSLHKLKNFQPFLNSFISFFNS